MNTENSRSLRYCLCSNKKLATRTHVVLDPEDLSIVSGTFATIQSRFLFVESLTFFFVFWLCVCVCMFGFSFHIIICNPKEHELFLDPITLLEQLETLLGRSWSNLRAADFVVSDLLLMILRF